MKRWYQWMGSVAVLTLLFAASPVVAEVPIVHAVLFYSPTCPHCHRVITNDLPPLFDTYGDQLQILGVDTSSPNGHELFLSAIQRFNIPEERRAVPMLIVDDLILLGSGEIPEKFPGLVNTYLAQGGVDWPDIPGLNEALAATQPQQTPTTEEPTPSPKSTQMEEPIPSTSPSASAATKEKVTPQPSPTSTSSGLILTNNTSSSLRDRLARDPVGNTLAILVLIGMLTSLEGALVLFRLPPRMTNLGVPSLAIPILCIVGFAIAAYLAYVETAQVTAVCGPVGDCNTVQQSEYSRLFGILPIGILGMVGYAIILTTWLFGRYGSKSTSNLAYLALIGVTLFGTFFSIYLTYLEPFVIGASCAWCLSSAVIMTALMWLSIPSGKIALSSLRQR